MSVNPDLIRARCSEIESSLARLETFRAMPREAFLGNQDILDLSCYRLLIAIEASLALCFHVTAQKTGKGSRRVRGLLRNIARCRALAC